MSDFDLSKEYNIYVQEVLDGKILACEDIILACRRYREWFERDDIYFDADDVDRRIRLVSKLRHFKGKSNGKHFILLPYQQFIFAGIFGWKWTETGLRVTRNVLIFMGRKNGKTSLASAICLTQILLDNNNGQEIDFIASTGAQARLGFDMTKNYAESIDPAGLLFTRYRDSIKMPSTKSEIDVRNSDAMTLDGLGSSTFIADEAHSYKTPDLWHVLKSSQGFQTQPLAICISTAGYLLDGYFLFEWVRTCKEILRGSKTDDSQFSLLYSLDDGDDWADEMVWGKANPSLGETVTVDYLRTECLQAKNQPSLEFGFRTKLMNQFCQSSDVWLTNTIIRNSMQPIDLSKLDRKEYVWGGLDLSTTKDLTSFSVMLKPNPDRTIYPDKYIFKTWCFISKLGVENSPNKALYRHWIDKGYLTCIDGNVIDYEYVKDLILEQKKYIRYDNIGYDKYNASQLIIMLEKVGVPTQPFGQGLGLFNKPTKDFERLILSDQVVIDYNPVVLWAFNNVQLVVDKFENIKPDKPTKDAKIDPVITIIQALGTYIYTQGAFGFDTEIYNVSGKK